MFLFLSRYVIRSALSASLYFRDNMLRAFPQNKHVSITYDCDCDLTNIVEHFRDALNHDDPSMSEAKDKVEPVFQVDAFIRNAPILLWKYFAININNKHALLPKYAPSHAQISKKQRKKDVKHKKTHLDRARSSLSIYFVVRSVAMQSTGLEHRGGKIIKRGTRTVWYKNLEYECLKIIAYTLAGICKVT